VHHVAPVAPHRADVEEHRPVLPLRPLERGLAPWHPPHRLAGAMAQERTPRVFQGQVGGRRRPGPAGLVSCCRWCPDAGAGPARARPQPAYVNPASWMVIGLPSRNTPASTTTPMKSVWSPVGTSASTRHST